MIWQGSPSTLKSLQVTLKQALLLLGKSTSYYTIAEYHPQIWLAHWISSFLYYKLSTDNLLSPSFCIVFRFRQYCWILIVTGRLDPRELCFHLSLLLYLSMLHIFVASSKKISFLQQINWVDPRSEGIQMFFYCSYNVRHISSKFKFRKQIGPNLPSTQTPNMLMTIFFFCLIYYSQNFSMHVIITFWKTQTRLPSSIRLTSNWPKES